jgi:hypothetical protein
MDFADAIVALKGQDVYLYTQPQVLDFTDPKKSGKLIICGAGNQIEIPLPCDAQQLTKLLMGLPILLENSLLIGWDIKSLFSYYLAKVGVPIRFGNVWDLKVLESFFGIDLPTPTTLNEARSRLVSLGRLSGWKGFVPIYKKVYIPLITETYPSLETVGLPNKVRKRLLYSHYSIDGQANGRSKCSRVLTYGYMPHTLSPSDKENIGSGDFNIFMYFDYRNNEVSVLQWLTQDPKLGQILRKKDVYAEIWKSLVEETDDIRAKEMGKKLFLPVVFGLGVKSLAKKLENSEEIARMLINRMYKTFPVTLDWVRNQSLDSNNFAMDYFGRRRKFEEGSEYKVRNFVVQAPASVICLRKLVNLFETLKKYANIAKICFHVHDGFCLVVKADHWKKIFNICKTALESEDELFPNLHLTVTCVGGVSLNNLKAIRRG